MDGPPPALKAPDGLHQLAGIVAVVDDEKITEYVGSAGVWTLPGNSQEGHVVKLRDGPGSTQASSGGARSDEHDLPLFIEVQPAQRAAPSRAASWRACSCAWRPGLSYRTY